jgi:hypothetical protein
MSEATPQTAEAGAGGGLDPDLAEELIRRAIAIDDSRPETVTLAEIKGTLAELGIPDKTVERAAAEVRQEITKAAEGVSLRLQWVMTVVFAAGFSIPGLLFINWGLMGQWDAASWLMLTMGGLWVLLIFGVLMDETYTLWKRRSA